MRRFTSLVHCARTLLVSLLIPALAPSASAVVIFDWVTIGNLGNPGDPQENCDGCGPGTTFGSVGYYYQISKYEVTNGQYTEFLNGVDSTGMNTVDLYSAEMGSSPDGGIDFVSGNPDGSKYVLKTSMDAKPVNFLTWFDAVRFANWLHNGQGSPDTESGAYTLVGGTTVPSNWQTVSREVGALVWLPSEDEWYKAAYYDPAFGIYYDYPAGSDTQTTCAAPTATPNQANCNDAVGALTQVGSYTGSPSPYGTFDQGGNIEEWNEDWFICCTNRVLRGGEWEQDSTGLAANSRGPNTPLGHNRVYGFRVAPEPGTTISLLTLVPVVFGLAHPRRRANLTQRAVAATLGCLLRKRST